MSDVLTKKQKAVLEQMPDTRQNIADELGLSYRSVRYHMKEIERKYTELERNSDAVWSVSDDSEKISCEDGQCTIDEEETDSESTQDESYTAERDDEEVKRMNTYSKAQATKDINNELLEIEKEVKEAIGNLDVNYPEFDNSKKLSTLVIPRTDDHFGVKVNSRSVNSEFSTPIARERINFIINDAIEKAKERGDVENVILPLLGDHLDGENVYPGHVANLEKFLREQVKIASSVYVNQIKKLSEEFEHVKVITCPGNHGSLDSISNADDIIFDQIEFGIDLLGIDNVSFVHSNGSYVNFKIRDYKAYGRHGQNALEHASTSSGDDRWMNWKEDSNFDVAYHGHHHQLRMEPVGHSQLFQCGTIVPPSLFVDSIGTTGIPRAFYHFTSDENLIEDMQIVDFE